MKVLTVCHGGQVRSVALANRLIEIGFNAIPTGILTPHPVNFEWLCKWADTIVLMVPSEISKIPNQHLRKVTIFDIGNDIWGDADKPDLKEKIRVWVSLHGGKYEIK